MKYLIAAVFGVIAFYLVNKLISKLAQSYSKVSNELGSKAKKFKFEPKKYIEILENAPKSKEASKIKLILSAVFFSIALCLIQDFVFSLIFAAAGYFTPTILINRKAKKQKIKFEEQLVDALGVIANCVRSGASLQQALEVVVKESKPPVSLEFSETLKQIKLGTGTDQAMKNMAQRVNSRDLGIVVLAINVAKEYGGNLGENLFKISGTIRERKKIQDKIDAITSQGRMSAWIITFIPFVLLAVLNFMEPSLFGLMFKTLIGKLLLLLAVAMVAVGNFIIMKIVSIDI
ncbi:MAG: type II secretion system F family protein [Elusimicrobia bacterium]|nr:type II secretion system F family protein [Elusimicrobiota bacterium]MBU2615364.1 type II secretion system F family protein [Elusimicrobiota bacterium]